MDKIDYTDVQILNLLQANGRMKRNDIAEKVGLSVPSVSERMRKLEEKGVIRGYHAVIDAKRVNMDITAYIRVTVDGSAHYKPFIDHALKLAEVLEIHSITGEGSHILKIRTKNTTTLEQLLSRLQSWPHVHGTSTSVVLSTYKETRELPVEPMTLPFQDLD
ncbi:MAG: Lrp/AsnC family transcriptional regulator [Rhodothermia bacterium]|nr:Lrp/AsnC family transcriptional regulator [Rhodothermia bacterium]